MPAGHCYCSSAEQRWRWKVQAGSQGHLRRRGQQLGRADAPTGRQGYRLSPAPPRRRCRLGAAGSRRWQTGGGGGGGTEGGGGSLEGQAQARGVGPWTTLSFLAAQCGGSVVGSMCGPRDVAVDSPTVTTATGEASGQDRSSAAGIFVLTVEHVHGGGGVLLFVFVIVLALVLAWCCARKKCSWSRIFSMPRSSLVTQLSEKVGHVNSQNEWLRRYRGFSPRNLLFFIKICESFLE